MCQQTGGLRQRFHHQYAGKHRHLMMAGPECRFVGGDIFDGAKAAFGNASAGRQDAVNQQTGKTVEL